MKNKIYISTVIIAAIAIFGGCKKGDTGPAGANGTNGTNGGLTGSIDGYVTLYNANGFRIENNSGASITIEGTALHAASYPAKYSYSFSHDKNEIVDNRTPCSGYSLTISYGDSTKSVGWNDCIIGTAKDENMHV